MNATRRSRLAALAALGCFPALCSGQGALSIGFEGAPSGAQRNVGTYLGSGVLFAPIAPGSLFLNGGGVPGYADNGTGYLEIPDALPSQGGLTFGFTNSFPSIYFNLLSFDAAELDSLGPQTLQIVGYKPMAGTSIAETSQATLTQPNAKSRRYPNSPIPNSLLPEVFGGRRIRKSEADSTFH